MQMLLRPLDADLPVMPVNPNLHVSGPSVEAVDKVR